jgi:DHA1 family chloramphenicol resistance protein-like MFS transporter
MWVPLALVLFGVGSYVGVTLAGRLSDDRPVQVLVVGAPLLVLGWAFLAVGAESAVALFVLVPVMGMLSFGVGSTLISRVLYESSGAPTMGGSYATAALNCGAVVGPVLGGSGLWGGLLAPVWTAVGLTGLGMMIAVACFRALRPDS